MGSLGKRLFQVAAVGSTVVASAIVVPSGAAFAPGGNPCALVSSSHLTSILGFNKDDIFDVNIGGTSPRDPTGVTESYCVGYAWKGSAPTSQSALIRALRNGSIAAYTFNTYFPHSVDPSLGPNEWTSRHTTNGKPAAPDFDFHAHKLTKLFPTFAASLLGRAVHVAKFPVPKLGASGRAGEQGILVKGVRAAGGKWWGDRSHSIIVIWVFDAARYPSAKQLNRIAKIAVPTFGL